MQQIDLVLLDIWMPGMDGLSALEKIKKDNPVLPVIMILLFGFAIAEPRRIPEPEGP